MTVTAGKSLNKRWRPVAPPPARLGPSISGRSAESGAKSMLHARELILIASHDIRSPLAAIKMSAEGIERRWQKGEPISDAECVLTLARIRKATDNAFALVNDLLSLERLCHHDEKQAPQESSSPTVDVTAVIGDAIAIQGEALERAGCDVSVQREAGLIWRGSWDRGYLLTIFSNLLQNASRHAPRAPVQITLCRRRDRLGIRFADHGPGFSAPSHFPRETVGTGTGTMGSLGLGLWIVRRAIAGLQGTLHIESSPGSGVTFEIELPGLSPELREMRSVARRDARTTLRTNQLMSGPRVPPRRADL